MKKNILPSFFVSALLFLMFWGCTSTSVDENIVRLQKQKQQHELIENIKDSTVAFVILKNDQYKAYCSGVWISKNYILTAAHCVRDDDEENVKDIKLDIATYGDLKESKISKAYRAKIIAENKKVDLALVKCDDDIKHSFVYLSKMALFTGDDVHIIGHPAGYIYTYVPGAISVLRRMKLPSGIQDTMMQVTAAVYFGNSGGGAFDRNGNLIGIASFISKVPLMSFFVHPETIEKFVNANIK